jgi:hypothetical protein
MSYKLSKEDFAKISQAKLDLTRAMRDLESVIHPNHTATLAKSLEQLTAGLANCYTQFESNWDSKNNHFQEVGDQNSFKSIWSNYDVDDLMTEHPYDAPTHVLYDSHWGKDEIRVPILGNTWLALWRAADTAIQLSGDNHHIFVESFEPNEDNTSELILHTGS